METENKNLADALSTAQKKLDSAKKELIQISKKAPVKSQAETENKGPGLTLAGSEMDSDDMKILNVLKRHFETLYKHLMKLMMTSAT